MNVIMPSIKVFLYHTFNQNARLFSYIFLITISLTFFLFTSFTTPSCKTIEESIFALYKIKTASYTLANQERIDNNLISGQQFVKWESNPFKCYLYFIQPNNGAELVFCEGKNNNEAIYYPNGFPYINLYLDPMGSTMRKNNHHTIYETGFKSFLDIFQDLLVNKNYIVNEYGIEAINGIQCIMIEANNSQFHFASHTLSESANIRSISKKYVLSEYLVAQKNKIDALKSLNKGTVILIPNSYAEKIKIWINIKNQIPVCMEFFDNEGLFEHYEIRNPVLNPSFKDDEFTADIFGKHSYK